MVMNNADREENPLKMEIRWRPEKLSWSSSSGANLSLWGYREENNAYPSLTYIDSLVDILIVDQGKYTFDPTQFRNRKNVHASNIVFGFLAMNLTHLSATNLQSSPMIWSRPMPLAWYFRPQWEKKYGSNGKWKKHFCDKWIEKESHEDNFANTVPSCPCTYKQAQLDRGRFSPDPKCNVIDRQCDSLHRGAMHCVRTTVPSSVFQIV